MQQVKVPRIGMKVTTEPYVDTRTWIGPTDFYLANRQDTTGVVHSAFTFVAEGYPERYLVTHDNGTGFGLYHISELWTDEKSVLVFDPGIDAKSERRNNYRDQLYPVHTIYRCPIKRPDIYMLTAFLQAYQPDVVEILNYYQWETSILWNLLGYAATNSLKVLAWGEFGQDPPIYLRLQSGVLAHTVASIEPNIVPGDINATR